MHSCPAGVITALREPEPIRLSAARALGSIRDPRAVEPLILPLDAIEILRVQVGAIQTGWAQAGYNPETAIEREEFDSVVRNFHRLFGAIMIEVEILRRATIDTQDPVIAERVAAIRNAVQKRFQPIIDSIDANPAIEAMLQAFQGPIQ